jgi:AAA15 family ATPase/GTPase
MLRRLELENFRGVGSRIELNLRPVTLLFGPNSAGKSTVLHALHLLHGLLEHGSPDVEESRIGGVGVDLGGFQT